MFKPPKIITDENERLEADCNAAAKRRWWATLPVREIAEHVAALKSAIRGLQPEADLPEYDIKDVEFAMPADFDAKKAEGEQLLASLQATLHRLRAEAAASRQAALSPTEKLEADNAALKERVAKLEAVVGRMPAVPAEGPSARMSRPRSEIPQMCMPNTTTVRPTHGWPGAPSGVTAGNIRLLRRGTSEAAERPAMLMPGSPHRKAMPHSLG
jgi:hypothetical protein